MKRDSWQFDLLICLATTALLWLGPLLDLMLHPENPLWLPYATTPDFMVYAAMFQRAALGGLTGDPFIWEHRVDPSALLAHYNLWPTLFGLAIHGGGEIMIPLLGWLLSTLWFFGLFRLCKGLGQPSSYAYFVAGLSCFFTLNLAYNLHGYKFNFHSWSFVLSEHLRPYPSASSMAVYTLAVCFFYKSLAAPALWRTLLASLLIGFTVAGRPFDWAVIETLVVLAGAVTFFQKEQKRMVICLQALVFSAIFAAPFLWKLSIYQHAHPREFQDQMWRGIFSAKSFAHYMKYTFGLVLIFGATLAGFRWATRGASIKTWTLNVCFPILLIGASLLPYYQTILKRVTVTGFAYFFVFSFATWAPIAFFQALWLRKSQDEKGIPPLFSRLPFILLLLVFLQQLGLGIGQRKRRENHIISPELRLIYNEIKKRTSPDTVILSFRSGAETVCQTGRWCFSPSPSVAAMLTSIPTRELLSRALWSEFLLTGSIEPLKPLFQPEGLEDFNGWLAKCPVPTRQSVLRLKDALGANTFLFHPQLSRYDLQARSLVLPANLMAGNDFAAWFPGDLRNAYAEVLAATRQASPISKLPFRLDIVLTTPQFPSKGGRSPSEIGFHRTRQEGGFEIWER